MLVNLTLFYILSCTNLASSFGFYCFFDCVFNSKQTNCNCQSNNWKSTLELEPKWTSHFGPNPPNQPDRPSPPPRLGRNDQTAQTATPSHCRVDHLRRVADMRGPPAAFLLLLRSAPDQARRVKLELARATPPIQSDPPHLLALQAEPRRG